MFFYCGACELKKRLISFQHDRQISSTTVDVRQSIFVGSRRVLLSDIIDF